jgi:hypothetical protein
MRSNHLNIDIFGKSGVIYLMQVNHLTIDSMRVIHLIIEFNMIYIEQLTIVSSAAAF